jgi:hypothetical protein
MSHPTMTPEQQLEAIRTACSVALDSHQPDALTGVMELLERTAVTDAALADAVARTSRLITKETA